ncbi:MAG: glycosyltransferase family 2 protein [Pyrinomonadaceae bacterium]
MSFEFLALSLILGMAWMTTLSWALGLVLTVRGIARQQPLAPASDEETIPPSIAPLVSILVPARNEEHRVISACLSSMANQDYPNLEIIAVNDRSTDATGDMLRRTALKDPRIQIIDGVEPPPGWLGKPHALAQAWRVARGEWVLATDADMIYSRSAVRTAVACAVGGNYDALTLIPRVICLSFWERVFMPTFGWFMIIALPIKRVNDPQRREAIGVGGFFLMRRAALERVGGYEAVRDEVAEDLRMAELLKGAGARLRIEYAPELISTRMQTNLREIWEGFTKNLFAGAKFSLIRTVFGAISIFFFAVVPFIVAFTSVVMLIAHVRGPWAMLLIPTLLTWTLQIATFAVVNKTWGLPLGYALTVPLGQTLFLAILLNSAVKIATGSGVTWKGRKLYDRAGGITPPRGAATERSPYENT